MAFDSREFARVWLKPLTLALLLAPGVWLAAQWVALLAGWPNRLGFNPVETTHHFLGLTAIRILLVTLAVTPFRDWTGWAPIMRVRRRIGLAAFFYALAHLLAYLGLDLYFSLPKLWEDVVQRIYITLGMSAFVLLIPLAITSHNWMMKKLGAVRWQRLHWLVYPIAMLAVLHHGFMVKGNQLGPWVHGGILAVLLSWRVAKAVGVAHPRTRSRARPAKA